MSFAILQDLVDRQEIQLNYEMARKNYIKALCKGLFKVMSKMGISTIRSYRGAKLFEAVGLSTALTDAYFGGTASSVGGIRLQEIAADAIALHHQAFRGTIDSLTLEHKGYTVSAKTARNTHGTRKRSQPSNRQPVWVATRSSRNTHIS